MRDDLEEEAADDGDEGDSSSGSDDESEGGRNEDSQANADAPASSSTARASPSTEDGRVPIPTVRPEAISASTYDIVPTVAAPQGTSINTVTATADMRWIFSGGSDGHIRQYNWVDSVNSKLMLTVAQRHPFVDSVQKAGVTMTYWENWDAPPAGSTNRYLSAVYSLASHSQGLWLLSGLESGGIRLQSIRHDLGKEIALLRQHSSAVSVLQLSSDEHSLLSGSWDKNIHDWDLNTGKVRTTFAPSSGAGQISAIEFRPESNVPVPRETGENHVTNGILTTNTSPRKNLANAPNGVTFRDQPRPGADAPLSAASPTDSLFGGDDNDDDLFGDAGGSVTNGAAIRDPFAEEDDEFSKAIADGPGPDEEPASRDVEMGGMDGLQSANGSSTVPVQDQSGDMTSKAQEAEDEKPLVNGLPHGDVMDTNSNNVKNEAADTDARTSSDSIFLSASIDGTIRVLDRRQPEPVARIVPRNTPPWCMNACWSPDGNYIYAGRRNGTVEEFSLHKGLRSPERVFKFPQGSGAVTSVKAMPNGRHLIWYESFYKSSVFIHRLFSQSILVLLMTFCVFMT